MHWKPDRQSHLTVHVQIVEWMKTRIERGDWTVGTKLPTQRHLAVQFEVNRSTINLVLDELKADGLLESKIGSGTFVANNSWNVLLDKSQPNWQHSLKSLSLESRAIGYSEPQGSKKLRSILCEYLKKRGIETAPENILIVSGALQALQLIAVGLLEEGAIIFQEHPSYLNSIHPFQSAGMRMIPVQRDDNLTNTLRVAKRKRQSLFYCVPTLHNPTGRNWTIEERKALYSTCKQLQIPIIEDDVYHELLFESSSPALKSFDQSGQVLYVGSVSKTLSPGLRIGWIVAPEPVIQRLADIKMQTDYGSSAFSQEIVAHWIATGLYESHILQLREQLKLRATFVEEILEQQFQHIATWEKSEGGFYIWLRFNEPIVNKALFLNLLKKNVLINPGYIYDTSDLHHIRLSYAYASLEELKEGLNILMELTRR
ncbi:PLP-dependent aminotransferase family protein [Heyndrickxia sporothermodurans]|uniref:aminotransferase-like domain-containing protein n=1 Tax=Heyndrickxia sporothermodurans TaxID=46224 RepID=UPI002DBFAE50|nr:PLP-dependent aminotransferase family protein [Heyndrickxia sporothermodurans]MEB6550812.1 PLP-dependent aminotransferase family protein [Heyndrickxia sporothermodurans]